MLFFIGCSALTADAEKMIIPRVNIEIQLIGFVWFLLRSFSVRCSLDLVSSFQFPVSSFQFPVSSF